MRLLSLLVLFSSPLAFAGPYEDGYRAGFADGYARGQQSCQPLPPPNPSQVTCKSTFPETWIVDAHGTSKMCNQGFGSKTFSGQGRSHREALANFLQSCYGGAYRECCDAAAGGYALRGPSGEGVYLYLTCF